MATYDVMQIPDNAPLASEQMGTKNKFWYLDVRLGRCLFKYPRPNTGEDWAEKVSAEIAELIGLPHARYELAEYRGANGTTCPTILAEGQSHIYGNELLARFVEGYDASTKRYSQTKHTVSAVHTALMRIPNLGVPPNCAQHAGAASPWGVMVGYLAFDVLIGNTDRHHENWAVVLDKQGTAGPASRFISPTFDHASSLGAHLLDEKRDRLLLNKDGYSVHDYIEKARSALYDKDDDHRPLRTIEAMQIAATYDLSAAKSWISQMAAVPDKALTDVLDRIPKERISESALEFARGLLLANRKRLLQYAESLK